MEVNSVGPDRTALLGTAWSGSALFAETCLPLILRFLRYDLILEYYFYTHDPVHVTLGPKMLK